MLTLRIWCLHEGHERFWYQTGEKCLTYKCWKIVLQPDSLRQGSPMIICVSNVSSCHIGIVTDWTDVGQQLASRFSVLQPVMDFKSLHLWKCYNWGTH